jgi:DNA-binding NarL/FixJ family response regulator
MEFTPRQLEHLKVIAEGWNWSELSRRQAVSPYTARVIWRFFLAKLEAKSGIELAEKARKIIDGL